MVEKPAMAADSTMDVDMDVEFDDPEVARMQAEAARLNAVRRETSRVGVDTC